jgi:hypothetical protein
VSLTDQLSDYMKQIPFWEPNSSCYQDIRLSLWNQKVHNLVHGVRHWSLSWVKWIPLTCSHYIPLILNPLKHIIIIIMALQPFVGHCPLFSISWSYTQSVGLSKRGIGPSQGLYLHTEQHKHRINAHNTDIHALSGIRSHDPSVRAGEDGSCLRQRGYCDRL